MPITKPWDQNKQIHRASVHSGSDSGSARFPVQVGDMQLLQIRPRRLGWSVYNGSDGALYIRFGSNPASAIDYSVKMAPDDYFECPPGSEAIEVHGIWVGAVVGEASVSQWE